MARRDSRCDGAGAAGQGADAARTRRAVLCRGQSPSKNPRQYRSRLRYTLKKHILPDLAMIPIASLTPGQIEALRDRKLAKGYKPATVNSMLKAISVMFIWARKQGSTTERIRRAGCARRRLRGLWTI